MPHEGDHHGISWSHIFPFLFKPYKKGKEGRDHEQGENSGKGQASQQDRTDAPVHLTPRTSGEYQGKEGKDAGAGAHEDRPDSGAH